MTGPPPCPEHLAPNTLPRSPDGWDQIPRWAGGWVLHQPPWSFGFDSQTRGTRENRAPPCVKVPGSSLVPPLSPSPLANSFLLGTAVINTHTPFSFLHTYSHTCPGPPLAPSPHVCSNKDHGKAVDFARVRAHDAQACRSLYRHEISLLHLPAAA